MSIYYSKPYISSIDHKKVLHAVKTGWGKRCYDYIKIFEKKFSNYIGSKYCHSTSSCTGAIHIALKAIGIKKGDEVILPDINWIAVAAAVVSAGGKPVFCDINKDSWCLDVQSIKKRINKKTKAVIALHLYGNTCDIIKIKEFCKKKKIFLIEDAAEALGSKVKGKFAGTFGDIGVFSFHGAKPITTGEGGMIITNNKKIYNQAILINNHGRHKKEKKQFWPEILGLKYNISNIQAALGCAQLSKLNKIIKLKRQLFFNYKKLFKDYPVKLNIETKGTINSFWMTTVIFNKGTINLKKRDNLIKHLKTKKIDTRVFFWPLSMLKPFKPNLYKKKNVISYDLYYRGINLPSYPELTFSKQKKVVNLIIKYLKLKKNVQ